jgi:hypothetical protein
MNPTNVGTCVPNGTIASGQPCVVSDATGLDDCLKGMLCDNDGANAANICRKYCTKSSDCTGANEKCLAAYNPTWGICLPTCTPYGSDCPSGNSCASAFNDFPSSGNTGFFVCHQSGTATVYASCSADTDCGDNLLCDQTYNWCTPICDSTHTCPQAPAVDGGAANITCQPFTNLSSGQGVCG